MSSKKPFPSSDLDVFKENSLILDNFVNSQENEYPDRFARKRPTITGIIKEAFNVRTDISNMNEALIGQSRWDVVPKNTSLTLGGDNGALNKQAQALFNRTVMLKVHAREALRRTYLEAGYNLVEGSFEQGGVLNNATDVLLQERTGKAFSGPAGTVAAGTNPASVGFVDKSGGLLRHELATSASAIGNANGGSVQDFIDAQYTTVAELATGKFQVGQYVRLTDRAMGLFLLKSGGTADGIGILDAGNGNTAILQHNGEVNIEQLGAVRGGDATAQVNYCTANEWAAVVPAYKYYYTKTDNRDDNPTIIGVKRPSCNEDKTQLVGGSILVGTLQLKGRNPTIMNIGIDHGKTEFPSTSGNALVLAHTNPFTVQSIATVQNVIGLGANVEDPFHAILVEGHYDTNIDNVVGIKTFFGAALKSTRNNISNAIFIDNGSDNLIIKSDTTSGKVSKVNVSNIICSGAGTVGAETTSFNVRLSAFNNDMDDVNISNVVGEGAAYVVYLDASAADAGTMKDVNISNVQGSETGRGVLIDGGTGTGFIDNINIRACVMDDVAFRAFEAKGNVGKLTVDDWYSSTQGSSPNIADAFQIHSTVESFNGSNIRLTIDGSLTTLAQMNLANGYANNQLSGNNRMRLNGVGIPRKSYTSVEISAADSTLSPLFDGIDDSLIRVTQSAAYSVNTIVRDMTGGTRFPHGHTLFILNDSAYTLTMKHNPVGRIQNLTSADIVVPAGGAIQYRFFNANWHSI